ncbi:hypothetical protein RN001_003664 [Aquatica leii]|uniref:Uncharacterized protein n=1 Tax=Aquatica leii TaxID=1421715 RepID=A0AAN7PIX5_9COLE|nr:hypothetical protein RN001_003664 [Aquatica leii]
MEARNYVAMPKMLQKGPSSSKTVTDVVSVAEEDSEHVAVISEPPPPSTPCSSDESCEEPKFTTVRRKSMRKIIKKEVAKAKKEINLIEVSEMDTESEAKEATTIRQGIRKSRNSRDEDANKATTDSEPRSTRETRRSRVPEEDDTPEEIELKKLMASYKTIMSLIPNTSARITMEDKRIIRAELHEIKLRATLMIGVTKELRHRANNSEAQAARTNVTQRVATATAPRNYAAAVVNNKQEERPAPIPPRNVQAAKVVPETTKTTKKTFKVRVEGKETGMTSEQVNEDEVIEEVKGMDVSKANGSDPGASLVASDSD